MTTSSVDDKIVKAAAEELQWVEYLRAYARARAQR